MSLHEFEAVGPVDNVHVFGDVVHFGDQLSVRFIFNTAYTDTVSNPSTTVTFDSTVDWSVNIGTAHLTGNSAKISVGDGVNDRVEFRIASSDIDMQTGTPSPDYITEIVVLFSSSPISGAPLSDADVLHGFQQANAGAFNRPTFGVSNKNFGSAQGAITHTELTSVPAPASLALIAAALFTAAMRRRKPTFGSGNQAPACEVA